MEGPFDDHAQSVIFDLELTAWEGSMAAGWSRSGEFREIIQIGAVKLGPGPGLPELGAFSCYVRPMKNPRLSAYITALTGITQRMIDRDALEFAEALARFDRFAGTSPIPLYCNGADHHILLENARWHNIGHSRHGGRMINIRRWLAGRLGVGDVDFSSAQVAALAGATPVCDPAHDALADARAIAAGLRLLCRQPARGDW